MGKRGNDTKSGKRPSAQNKYQAAKRGGGREGTFFNTMPVLIPSIERMGVKIVNRIPGRKPALDSQILLYDSKTGECLAMMDANWITAMRTGAVAAHSMKLFAKSDFKVLAFIGLGNIACAVLDVFLALFPKRELTVKLKTYKDQHYRFAGRYADHPNIHFEFVNDYRDAVKGSDIAVSAATYFEEDICDFDCIDKGSLIIPVHTKGFTDFDDKFDKIFADDTAHIQGFKNFSNYKNLHEVCEVVNGLAKGRENDEERIMVYNIGIALHDIYFANKLYERIGADCPEAELNPPKEKLWI